MNTWRADWLLRVLLTWTSLTFLIAWLPFVRSAMDGDTYTWGFGWWGFAAGGTGLTAQYWLPAVLVALGVTLLWFGSRGARTPFHWLLLAWHTALFTSFSYQSWANPDDFRFQGDTAGIDFSIAWVGPAITGAFLVASIFWVVRDLRKADRGQVPPWTRANTMGLGSLIALLPVQFVLLRFGPTSGSTDVIGVLITVFQWMLLPTALTPRGAPVVKADPAPPADDKHDN